MALSISVNPPVCSYIVMGYSSSSNLCNTVHEGSVIDYSESENRLVEHTDGSFEVIPKTPAEVFGEQVLRPAIDTIYDISIGIFQTSKNIFCSFDGLLSKTLNFVPGASAQQPNSNMLQNCIQPHVDAIVKGTDVAIAINDAKLLDAVRLVAMPLIQQCYVDNTYNQAYARHVEHLNSHKLALTEYENMLKKCNKEHGGNKQGFCLVTEKSDRKPELFEQTIVKTIVDPFSNNNIQLTLKEWTTSEGFTYWKISAYHYAWPNSEYAVGSYNYNIKTGQSEVPSRLEILGVKN